MMKKIFLGIGILVSLISLWYSSSYIARWYVLNKYPFIQSIERIVINFNGIQFYDVVIHRNNVQGTFKKIDFDYQTEIMIENGFLDVNLTNFDQGRLGSENLNDKKYNIVAKNLDINVQKDHYLAKLVGVSYNDPNLQGENKILFKELNIKFPEIENMIIQNGVYDLINKTLSIGLVSFEFELPIQIPTLEKRQLVKITSILIDINNKKIEIPEIQLSCVSENVDFVLINSIIIYSNDAIKLIVKEFNTMHPWLRRSENDPFVLNEFEVIIPTSLIQGSIGIIKFTHKTIEIEIDLNLIGIKTNQASCSSWLNMTSGLEFVDYEDISGQFGFEIVLKPDPKIKINSTCKVNCEATFITNLKKEFTYIAYHANGESFERITGPRTSEWVSLIGTPPWVSQGFILFEDPWFERHTGYQNSAFLNSLKANLKAKGFVRGGSTITMQLAKNLWLGRQKTIDRKFQEVILSTFLESCFLKYEILDLYVNVIEFGPDVYGIKEAARHYFKKEVGFLSPLESFYLARILPRPQRATPPQQGGLERIKKLLTQMLKTGNIPPHLVLEEDLAFYIGYEDGIHNLSTTEDQDLFDCDSIED